MKCSATTRLSSRVSDRPSELSQILEMGELRPKLAVLATENEWARPGTMPSSALPALATHCDRRPKDVVLEHNSNAITHDATPRYRRFHGLSIGETASRTRRWVGKRRELCSIFIR